MFPFFVGNVEKLFTAFIKPMHVEDQKHTVENRLLSSTCTMNGLLLYYANIKLITYILINNVMVHQKKNLPRKA